jgi:signal recognition particle GTPase
MKNKINGNSSLETVTGDEVAQLKDFLAELDRLEGHRSSAVANARQKVHLAQSAYYDSSSDENFANLRSALIDESVSAVTAKALLNSVAAAVRTLGEKKFQPFVRPIIERLLSSARSVLEQTEAAENKRHQEMFGSPLHGQQGTTALAAARGNVSGLEHLRAIASRPQIDQSAIRQVAAGLGAA